MWSLHKENSPNVQQPKNENLQNTAALTSPRWNQKFSSLVPRKKPKTEKGQRVRGPAIQWTAETLFGTADEAKGYITRDAKWKFRYSHQTTEGKKVYYQCTQRAKLGCGALCHVVYHQNGTALLYTNGEQHNHSYHDALTGLKPNSNTHKVGSQQNVPVAPTTAPVRLREEWSLATIFPNPNDAKLFIEQEALWKFSYSHSGTIGRKVFYDCTLKAKEGCPAKVQLIYHSGEPIVSYLINGASHKHQSDYVCRKRGLSPQIKDTILEAFDSGFTDTKQVTKFLQLKGLDSPTVGKIRMFLNKHRPQGFENVPVSMLQWSTEGEDDVMGELTAAC